MKLNIGKGHYGHYLPLTPTDTAAICRARNGELRSNQPCVITIFAYKHPSEVDGQDPHDNRTYQEYPVGTYFVDGDESEWISKPDSRLIGDNLQWVSKIEIVPESMRRDFRLEIRWKEA